MRIVEYPDANVMMRELAHLLAGELTAHLATHETASFAVPGGTTPGPIFDVLSATPLEWDRVDILLTDERWVPGDHPRSNTLLLHERLLTDAAARANYLSLYSGDEDAETGAAAVAEDVDRIAPISVLLLGMGGDMHTASLFPGADNLGLAMDKDAPAVVAITGGGAPEPRVTLSARILQGALCRHIVITGAEKRDALERAAEMNDALRAPVCTVLAGTTVHWAE